jgi:F0F1-type ATP synthase membrane subunit b/b'
MKNIERVLNNRILRVRAKIDRLQRELDRHDGRCERLDEQIAEARAELGYLMYFAEEED